MNLKLIGAVAAIVATSVSGLAHAGSIVTQIEPTLSASPPSFSGKCPAVITFNGTIRVTGHIYAEAPVQIGYAFVRSDGATGPISYYNVTASGTQAVSTTWTLGATSAGWEQLQAWPVHHEGGYGPATSGRASFSLTCLLTLPPGVLRPLGPIHH